jgi:large subunit ribosomal protein L1
MKKEQVLSALTKLDANSPKRNFAQSVELVITFKDIDLKKPANLFDLKVDMPYSTGRGEGKALLFATSKPFSDSVKTLFSRVIFEDEIAKMKKKEIAELLGFDVLLAEGPVMIAVGKYLGQDLAPKGKMPRPIPANPELVKTELAKMKAGVRVTNKKGKGVPMVQVLVGKENMKPEELAENISKVYMEVEKALPKQRHNIKAVRVKKTMSPVVKIEF